MCSSQSCKHGLVDAKRAEDYPFCSYSWLLEKADDDFQDTVMNQPINRVNVLDNFDN
jgi:hypothetical protein